MIHLVIPLPLPYQQTLCRALSESFESRFMAWFARRRRDDFPYKNEPRKDFPQRYLCDEGYGSLFRALAADREAVVILGGWHAPMTLRTLLICWILRVPVFIWADHPFPRDRGFFFELLRKACLRALNDYAAGFLVCGWPTLEHLVTLGVSREKITVFPYWTEVPDDWTPPDGADAGCPADQRRPLRMLGVGRHVRVKRFDVVIEAVASANCKAGNHIAELVLVGEGPERVSLEQQAKSSGFDRSFTFKGWLENDEVRREITDADAVVVPSAFEPYGVVVLEAMAAGRPVLASEGVIAAHDRDEGAGAVFFHPVGGVNQLANQIAELAADRGRLLLAAQAARATALKWRPGRAAEILRRVLSTTKPGRRLLEHPVVPPEKR